MPDLRASLDVPYGAHAHQQSDLFVPDHPSGALVIAFHGGWWTGGSHHDLRPFALHLAALGHACASVGFRPLGADAAHHGQQVLEDAQAGATRVLEEAALHGLDPRTAILLGSGSGSLIALNLAAKLAPDAKWRIRGCIAAGVTPSLDHGDGCAPHLTRVIDQFAGSQRHALSPVHLHGEAYPPLLLLHGDTDGEVPAKLAQRLHQRVIEAGGDSALGILSSLGHQFIEHPGDRGGRLALERILPFLKDHARDPDAVPVFAGRVAP